MLTKSTPYLPPELVTQIFHAIEFPRTLLACALVSRQWAALALPLLWRGSIYNPAFATPTLVEIAACRIPVERLRMYLGYARVVTARTSEWGEAPDPELVGELLDGGAFDREWRPSTRWLTVGLKPQANVNFANEQRIGRMLGSELVGLELSGDVCGNGFLNLISRICPKLEYLYLDDKTADNTAGEMIAFLEAMPSLSHILLHSPSGFSSDLVVHLLSRPNIEQLQLYDYAEVDETTIMQLQIDASTLPSLYSLELRGASGEALRQLIPMLPNLMAIKLSQKRQRMDPSMDVLEPLSLCPKLQQLILHTKRGATITMDSLIALAEGCPDLHTLVICSVPGLGREGGIEANLQWKQFVQAASNLEELIFDIDFKASSQDLGLLAQYCPRLRKLSLRTGLDLATWAMDTRGAVFTSLESLFLTSVHSFVGEDSATSDHFLEAFPRIIDKHMPHLVDLSLSSSFAGRPAEAMYEQWFLGMVKSRNAKKTAIQISDVNSRWKEELANRHGIF